jgi:uncharacterized membrane protein YccC
VRFDRSAVSPSGGLIAAIPVTAVFGGAIAAGDPVAAATMGAGAMLVGIAWRVAGGAPPIALLTFDALLMALATFLGSASGALPWLHLIVVFAWSLATGLLVALGRRGAVLGTQAIIGLVVFGRFSQPLPGALGLAGLVLAGGLAMVVFVAIVRWPTPLKIQRRAVAEAYRALAELASGPSDASTIPAATRLDEARTALSSPMLFGDPAVLRLRGLTDEASRLRIELRAIHVLLEQGVANATARDGASGAGSRALLDSGAATLRLMAAAIEGDGHASAELEALAPRLLDPEAPAAQGAAISGYLEPRLDALRGQLRAMARRAPAAGQRGRLVERRLRLGSTRPYSRLRSDLAQIHANATLQSPAGRHALRLAVVVLVTEILSQHVPLQRSYWMVVAAATALRPEFAATFTRGAERILGTCAGVALAGLIVVGVHPSLATAVAIIAVLGWIAYSVFPASFAVGFAFITALVVFLLDAVTTDTLATASDRLLDTIVGGSIGLLAYALWPTWSQKPARQSLADLVRAQRAYLAAVMDAIVAARKADEREVASLARGARMAFTSAQETVARSLAEPSNKQIDPEQSQGILGALRRLVSAVHVLRTETQDDREHAPVPDLAPLAEGLDQTLELIAEALPASLAFTATDIPLALPQLRERYTELAHSLEPSSRDGLLLRELDEIVDAVNSLAVMVDAETPAV